MKATRTLVVLTLSTAAVVSWTIATSLAAFRGFDITDEGYYLLSYRWWAENLRTFTGVQYIYGPIFEVFNYNIAALRLFRVFTLLITHCVFGWAFMGWLRTRQPNADPSHLWEWAGTAAITACGGMAFSWLPLSPGYNDVSLLTAMLAAAVLLRVATYVTRQRPIPFWLPLSLGPVVAAGLLAKWASCGLTFLAIATVTLWVLRPVGFKLSMRFAAITSASIVAAALAIQLLVIPLTAAIPEMLQVNRIVAAGSNSPANLIYMYIERGTAALMQMIRGHWLLLIAAAVSGFTRFQRIGIAVGCMGLAQSIWTLSTNHGFAGGTQNLRWFPLGLLAVLLVALVAGSLQSDHLMIGLLLLLPLLQAAGTGNVLHYMAVNGFAVWMAVIIFVTTGIRPERFAARWLASAALLAGIVLCTSIAITGTLVHPYRTGRYDASTATVPEIRALNSLQLTPQDAAAFDTLHTLLRPYLGTEGRPIMAFDSMAGIVLLLGGRPVGEAWYSSKDRYRTSAGITAECQSSPNWLASRAPLLLFHRPIAETDLEALRSCGFEFASDYKLLTLKENSAGLSIYVPTTEVRDGTP